MPDPIEQRLGELPTLGRNALLQLWQELFHASPPPKLRRLLMIPILAYRLQEQEYGPLTAPNRHRLLRLAQGLESNSDATASCIPSLKPGTRLVRQWRDQVHLVNVEAVGYEYQEVRYQSLSEIARLITGTRWSGPLFFGTKNNRSKKAKELQ